MPVPLVYNPRAARGAGERLAARALDALARHGVDARLVPTTGPGGAAPLAEALARAGGSRILALGGDGTHSEAAEGVLRSGNAARVELGFLPGGTGNDFLLDFGIRTVEDAARRIASSEPARALDAGRARWDGGERFFIDVFGTGFMANVADRANRSLKAFGARGYTLAVFPELARLRAPMTRLTLDDDVIEERFVLVAVCNTMHMGGAMRVAPMATPDDGAFDIIALRDVGRARLLRLFPRIFSGTHVGDERVLVRRASRRVRIEPTEPGPLLGDGEIYGRTPVEVELLPRAVRVLV